MEPIAIVILFFVVLAALTMAAALAPRRGVRLFSAVASLGWAGLMFMAAGWAVSLNHNSWYSSAASKMLEAFVTGIEGGRQDLVLREMKRMTKDLDVTYERRGNFRDLAERAARTLAHASAEPTSPANVSVPIRPDANR